MDAKTSQAATIPTPEELIARAEAMIPKLRERSAHTEALRKIPQETVDAFREAGFFRIAMPTKYQGYNYGIDVIAEVAMQIGRGCGSSAWMAGQWPGHQFMVRMFSAEAQEEYWGEDPDTMSSTASAVAKLNIEPERGGWRIRDSQMRFSSGCDYAQWIFFITQHGMCLIPKSDFVVLDDWYVAGLRGTGSKSVVIADAWVPPHRFVSIEDMRDGTTPGNLVDSSSAYLNQPFALLLNQSLAAPAIGMANGVLDLFEERVVKRFDLHTFKPAAEGAGVQLRFAEACAEVDGAKMFLRNNLKRLAAWGAAGHHPDMQEKTLARRDVTYCVKLSVQAAHRLLSSGDASGMFDDQQLGRLGRDVQMAGLQASLTWDEPAQSFARARWGLEQHISYLTG